MRKKGIAIFVLVMFMFTMILPSAYAAPPWWDKIKKYVKADIVGGLGGYVTTGTGLGAIFGAAGASIQAGANEEGASGSGWDGTEAEYSVGYHHNLALDNVYGGIGSIDITSDAGKLRMNQLLENYLENNVLETFIALDGNAPGTETAKFDAFLKIEGVDGEATLKSVDPNFEKLMEKINEALRQGKITDKFYNDFLIAFEMLENDADDPRFLIESAADYLWRETAQGVADTPPTETLSLNFSKIVIAYENEGEEESDVELNAASEVIVDILNSRPTATSASAEVEAMELILAAIFADVAEYSYDYWMQRAVYEEEQAQEEEEEEDTRPGTKVDILLTIGQNNSVVNEQEVSTDVAPFIENQRTFLPFRFIGEQLGATVEWVPEERKVTYELDGTNISLYIDENRAMVNGMEVFVDSNDTETVPFIRDSRTMVPVRFISEALGFHVEWNGPTQQVLITNDDSEGKVYSWGR